MNNTKICVFALSLLISNLLYAYKSKKCFPLLDQNKYESAYKCFKKADDTTSIETLFGLAESLIGRKADPTELDSAFSYAHSAQLQYDTLVPKDKQKLADKLGISQSSFSKIKNRAAFYAYRYTNDTVLQELEAFAIRFPETPSAQEATTKVEELNLFATMPQDKPLDYYKTILDKYPNNSKINDIWQIYYQKYTNDGELLTLEKFSINYPQYPFPNQIQRDRNTAQMAERHKLDLVYTPSLAHIYDAYIKLAAPQKRALKALRMYISPYIKAKQFARAADTVKLYSEHFGEDKEFEQMLSVLTEKESVPTKMPVPGQINTAGSEFSPVLTKNDRVMYFCGKEREGCIGGEDIFVSYFADSAWGNPEVIPGVNTVLGHEAPESLSADGTKLLLFQNGDIYYSDKYIDTKKRLRWSDPIRYKTINTAGWEGDASLTSDGKALLFASESGQRENPQFISRERKDLFDIFVSVKTGDSWSTPVNLGPIINTSYCDRYPFLHPDMKTLYFSSEGHGSIGGLDVFMAKRLNDSSWTEWSDPVNLGRYVNTIFNDTGYKISNDGNYAYYAGYGGAKYDIYKLELPEDKRPQKIAIVSGQVLNTDSIGVCADILVEDLDANTIIGEFRSDVQDGSFTMVLPLGHDYGYFVSKNGFFPSSDNIDLTSKTDMVEVSRQFVLQSIDTIVKYKQPIEINNVFFASNNWQLQDRSFGELDRLARIVADNDITELTIYGHTDSIGSDTANIALSLKRAQSVADYLSKKEMPNVTIDVIGGGSAAPVAENTTEEGRALNRRVEVVFGKNE